MRVETLFYIEMGPSEFKPLHPTHVPARRVLRRKMLAPRCLHHAGTQERGEEARHRLKREKMKAILAPLLCVHAKSR